ncbi:hypothetical protein LTS08_004520 [Lithohypha guttulata]|nr:hypothetical protein LTS08_004520 [Lithohypha guttulata]
MAAPRPGYQRAGSSIAVANKTIVLVAGGHTGPGYEIVKTLTSLRSDYQILLGCNEAHAGEQAASSMGAPSNVNPIQIDTADDQSIDHGVKAIEQHFGRIDILINAENYTSEEPANKGTGSRELWQRVFGVNVIGTALLTERAMSLLEHSKGARIIFLGDESASMSNAAGNSGTEDVSIAFSASKAAVNRLALHYAAKYPNVVVNVTCPTTTSGNSMDGQAGATFDVSDAVRLATERQGSTATFTSKSGSIAW